MGPLDASSPASRLGEVTSHNFKRTSLHVRRLRNVRDINLAIEGDEWRIKKELILSQHQKYQSKTSFKSTTPATLEFLL